MKNSNNGILTKINTLKINSNKIYQKKNSEKYITPRQTHLLKNPLDSNTSTKIKVNILNNEENINSNNIQKRIRKSKSKPKLIKKDSKKDILISNKSFNNKTVKNKNKKNDINYNISINTFFTTQNDNKIYTTTTTNTEKDLKVNTKIKKKKSKLIKKRKSFGYVNIFFIDNINTNSNTNSNTNYDLSKQNYTTSNKSIIKKAKSNTNIKINLNKNLNNSINSIKIKKIENPSKINSNAETKNRISKSAKKLILRKNQPDEEKNLIIKVNNNNKSKINLERNSINESNLKINIITNQILSPIKANKKSNLINNINNNSEYKKKNNSFNLFNNNKDKINKITNKKINSKNNQIKNIKNVVNKNKKITGRKTTNNRPSKILNKNENDNNKKIIDKNKSLKIDKMKIKEKNEVNQSNKSIEKEENSDLISKVKSDEDNINSLNSYPKSSSNRLKVSNRKKVDKNDSEEIDLEELKKVPIKKKDLSKSGFNNDKIIIKFDDLIEFDLKLDSIISSFSFYSSENDNDSSNECSEFFSFYFHSSLNNILSNFFSKKNRIIINSGNNLLLFSIVILYHLSLNKKMLKDLLDDMKYIFSLLKINYFFIVKKIEFYYKDDFPINCADLFNQKFVQYNTINCSNEIDLISKINKNCCNISERMKLIMNYYDRNKNRYFDEFSGIFKNLSTLKETDINSYFFSYVYINPFNSENNKINEVNNININYKNRKSKSIPKINTKKIISSNNYSINSDNDSDNYLSDNFSYKSDKIDNERELLSVKSYKSIKYYGRLKPNQIADSTTINCDNNFYYNIENNIYENDEDGTNAYEIMKMIKEYEINKASEPFIITQTKKRYTLILDLDETLIHLRQKKEVVNIKNDVNININNISDFNYNSNKEKNKYLLQFRVGLFSFLTLLKPFYEIISFTSASKEYADVIINEIEKKRKFFDFKFYREHCVIYKDTFVKDISRIGRDIQKIIIIDNNENNFVLNKENGIKIYPYYGDDEDNIRLSSNKRKDNALLELKKILIMIYKDNYDDIREALKDYDELIKMKVTME